MNKISTWREEITTEFAVNKEAFFLDYVHPNIVLKIDEPITQSPVLHALEYIAKTDKYTYVINKVNTTDAVTGEIIENVVYITSMPNSVNEVVGTIDVGNYFTEEDIKIGTEVESILCGIDTIHHIHKDTGHFHVRFDLGMSMYDSTVFNKEGKERYHKIQTLYKVGDVPESIVIKEPVKYINGVSVPDITVDLVEQGKHYYVPSLGHTFVKTIQAFEDPGLVHARETNHYIDKDMVYPFTNRGRLAAIKHAQALFKAEVGKE